MPKNVPPATRRMTAITGSFLRRNGLAKMLGAILFLALLQSPRTALGVNVPAANTCNLTLGWDASSDPGVAGYRIYYGTSSGNYSANIFVANATTATVSNLVDGVTYFLTIVAVDANGLESSYASEISFTQGIPTAQLQMMANGQVNLTVGGLSGHTYEVQATQDFITWSVIGTVSPDVSASAVFSDTNAPNFSKRFYRIHEVSP